MSFAPTTLTGVSPSVSGQDKQDFWTPAGGSQDAEDPAKEAERIAEETRQAEVAALQQEQTALIGKAAYADSVQQRANGAEVAHSGAGDRIKEAAALTSNDPKELRDAIDHAYLDEMYVDDVAKKTHEAESEEFTKKVGEAMGTLGKVAIAGAVLGGTGALAGLAAVGQKVVGNVAGGKDENAEGKTAGGALNGESQSTELASNGAAQASSSTEVNLAEAQRIRDGARARNIEENIDLTGSPEAALNAAKQVESRMAASDAMNARAGGLNTVANGSNAETNIAGIAGAKSEDKRIEQLSETPHEAEAPKTTDSIYARNDLQENLHGGLSHNNDVPETKNTTAEDMPGANNKVVYTGHYSPADLGNLSSPFPGAQPPSIDMGRGAMTV